MSELNDPRVFMAAERTLLAWNRTSLTLMAFGFAVERFGLFAHMLFSPPGAPIPRGGSFWVGLAFIALGVFAAFGSVFQYHRALKTLRPVEIPPGYAVHFGSLLALAVALLGLGLMIHLGLQSTLMPHAAAGLPAR